MKESDIQKQIMLALSQAGCVVWRNNTGMIKNPQGRPVRFGLCVGSSDIIGIGPGGRFLAIEVKTAKGRATEKQLNFINRVIKAGGIAGVARSADEAVKIIDDFKFLNGLD